MRVFALIFASSLTFFTNCLISGHADLTSILKGHTAMMKKIVQSVGDESQRCRVKECSRALGNTLDGNHHYKKQQK